jgi:CheY-like chemotaxis protein
MAIHNVADNPSYGTWIGRSCASPSTSHQTLARNAGRARVLVLRDQRSDGAALQRALRALDVDSAWARDGQGGTILLRHTPFDVVLIDEQLPDMDAVDVIRALRGTCESCRFVILKGDAHAASGTNSQTFRTLQEPYRCLDVINAVVRSNGPGGERLHGTAGSIAERWAQFVLGAVDATRDPKTVAAWARGVGVGRSVLSECCRLVHVPAHDARDFARLLRAICHSGGQWRPEAVLDLADARTLKKLCARAGLSDRVSTTPTMRQFLAQQLFIPRANSGLRALESLLLVK